MGNLTPHGHEGRVAPSERKKEIMTWYAPTYYPKPHERDLAELCARIVSVELGINAPRVEFFREHVFGSIQGSTGCRLLGETPSRDVIRILCDLPPATLCRVVRHECRHLLHHIDPAWTKRSHSAKERDARLFSYQWLIPNDWDHKQTRDWLLRSVVVDRHKALSAIPGIELRRGN